MQHTSIFVLSLLAIITTACVPLDDAALDGRDCRVSDGAASLGGSWTITGRGSRAECLDSRFNTESFEIDSAAFKVAQDELGGLSLAEPRAGFQLTDGSVRGVCLDFTTVEEIGEAEDNLIFEWAGEVRVDDSVTGTFTGQGPSGCVSSGTFTVVVR
jgi:hypothetical protein